MRGEKEQGIIQWGNNKKSLHVCALGMSIGTAKNGITAEVIEVANFDELKQAGADTSIVDDNNKTVDNYLRNILERLEKSRQRTVRNEQGDLIHMYQSIRELLLKE